MPGMIDCVSIIEANRNRTKRSILCNLREAYTLFKEKFPHIKVSFSKFAELRPKQCILADKSGTHSVCLYYPPKCKVNN